MKGTNVTIKMLAQFYINHIGNHNALFIRVNAATSYNHVDWTVSELSAPAKCKKCKIRDVTGEDGVCDSCRFVLILDNMIEEKKPAAKHLK